MKLLDFPAELIQDIVDEMIVTVGLYQSVRLRVVCRVFDELIVDAICRDPEWTFKNHFEHCYTMISPSFLAIITKLTVEHDTQRKRPLSVLFDQVVDLVVESDTVEPARVGNARFSSQREELLNALSRQMSQSGCHPSLAWNLEVVGEVWTAENKILAALTAAAATGNIPAMKRMIDRCPYDEWHLANKTPLFGVPLSAATFHGQLEATIFLLDIAAKRDFKSNYGWCRPVDRELILNSLHVSGHPEIVNIAFIPKYELFYSEGDYERAILGAVRGRHGKIAMSLFHRANIIENRTFLREKMFKYAANYGCEQTIIALMGSVVGEEENSGEILEATIETASRRGHIKVVQLLLNGKYKFIRQVLSGALTQAVKRDHYHVAQILLDRGANINMIGPGPILCHLSPNMTPIGVAAMSNQPHMVRFLLEQGADVNAHGHGSVALHFACLLGLDLIVSLLVEGGVDPNSRLELLDGLVEECPIQIAMVAGQDHVVQLLLRLGVEQQEPISFTPRFFYTQFRTPHRESGTRVRRFPYRTYARQVSEHVWCMDSEKRAKLFACIL